MVLWTNHFLDRTFGGSNWSPTEQLAKRKLMLWKLIHFERITFQRVSGWCNVALGDMLRLSEGLANQWFSQSDISRVQLKSNWTVGKRLLASDFETVWKNRLIWSKSLLIFFNGWYGNSFISKELALKEPLDDVMLHLGNCSDIQMHLPTDHFVTRTFWESKWSPIEQLVKGF